MSEPIRLSVVVPVFNRHELAVRALRSALAQDVAGMEVVVVDDGSHPPQVLPQDLAGDPRVRLLRQANAGESGARNAGIAAARGNWIAFLDSDDYWLAGTLAPRLAFAEQHYATKPPALVAQVAGVVVDNKRTGQRQARLPRESRDIADFASGCWFWPGTTALLRKDAIGRVGDYDIELRRLTDLDWFLRFALAGGRLQVWPHVVAVVETGSKRPLGVLNRSADHLQDKYAGLGDAAALAPHLLRRLRAYLDVERASVHAAHGDWAQTVGCLARSWWRAPRTTIVVENFWRRVELPPSLAPAGAPVIGADRPPISGDAASLSLPDRS